MDDTDLLARSVRQWRVLSAAVRAFVGNHVLQAHAEVGLGRVSASGHRAQYASGPARGGRAWHRGGGAALATGVARGHSACQNEGEPPRPPRHANRVAPRLPHDAREPSDSELSAIRVDVRQYDYIRCVWCGVKRVMKQDKGVAYGYLKDQESDMKDGVLVERFGCPMFQALHDRGLVKAWRDAHLDDLHEHDRWILDKECTQQGPIRQRCTTVTTPASGTKPKRYHPYA